MPIFPGINNATFFMHIGCVRMIRNKDCNKKSAYFYILISIGYMTVCV